SVSRSMAAVPDIASLIAGDNPTDYRLLPVIIRGNQSSAAIVQLQGGITQCIGNAILSELRAYGANNHPLWFGALDNKAANHYVVARLHKAASANVGQDCSHSAKLKRANVRDSHTAIPALVLGT